MCAVVTNLEGTHDAVLGQSTWITGSYMETPNSEVICEVLIMAFKEIVSLVVGSFLRVWVYTAVVLHSSWKFRKGFDRISSCRKSNNHVFGSPLPQLKHHSSLV